jgi:hypothetical protein
MTNSNEDLSTIADPGSMSPDAMTEPDASNRGDIDHDHEDLTDGGPDVPGEAVDSPAAQGSPTGPLD